MEISKLVNVIDSAKAMAEEAEYDLPDLLECSEGKGRRASLFLGDNLEVLRYMTGGEYGGKKPSVIYIDPPFFSDSKYDAVTRLNGKNIRFKVYDDRWDGDLTEYLTQLTARLILMREVLDDRGTIWVHLDHHVSHYAKIIMDEVFGEANFVNEVIWAYKSGGSTKRRFARKHDTLLVYSKRKDYKFNEQKEKSYNRDLKPYRFDGVEEFEDEKGWYTLVNMKDVWNIDMVGRTSGERTGYATQKPRELMRRILLSCSDEGDTVADFFSGSGAFASEALRLGRDVIASDIGAPAIETTLGRAKEAGSDVSIFAICSDDGKSCQKLDVELVSERNDDGSVEISIDEVILSGMEEITDKKAYMEIEKALSEDPMSLIGGISFGKGGIDGVHRPLISFAADEEELPAIFDVPSLSGEEIVSVKVWDIFGDMVYKSLII